MMVRPPVWIECQDCGAPLYGPLTAAEERELAQRPYDFVWWCRSCSKEHRGGGMYA